MININTTTTHRAQFQSGRRRGYRSTGFTTKECEKRSFCKALAAKYIGYSEFQYWHFVCHIAFISTLTAYISVASIFLLTRARSVRPPLPPRATGLLMRRGPPSNRAACSSCSNLFTVLENLSLMPTTMGRAHCVLLKGFSVHSL